MLEQRSLKGPIRFTRVELATARLVERVHHFAEDIQLQLRVYHEVSVLKAGEQSYEYVNCHAGSGLMNGLAPAAVGA